MQASVQPTHTLGCTQHPRTRTQELQAEVDVVINSAATTTFDERLDVAVRVNTLGALHCAEWAAGCANLAVLVRARRFLMCTLVFPGARCIMASPPSPPMAPSPSPPKP